uniref:Uncharacterized protein n=1 Tax=Glossina brevipalpis TaxID=37001 RepID=A0A1A9WXJ8_9MUSC
MHAVIEVLQAPIEAGLQLHFLPTKILADEVTKVKNYFDIYTSSTYEGFLENSLRGHLLLGEKIQVPGGFKTVVLQESDKPPSDVQRKLKIKGCFQDFIYWNYDRSTKQANLYKQAIEALRISDVLSDPIDEKEVTATMSNKRNVKQIPETSGKMLTRPENMITQ